MADLVEDSRLTKESLHHVGQQAAAELRRLERMNAELVEAVTRLLQNFPTDGDMAEAGWDGLEIEAACQAYDRARAALTSATKEQQK